MIYTTILVQLDIDAPATPRLIFARQVARKFEADLIALAAAEPSALVSPSESSPAVA
ncbi:MAG: universal stress protein UspA, partial [Mesorhizobium sp.]